MGTPDDTTEFQTPEFQKLHDAMTSLDVKFSKQTIYMHALEFAILYHCAGKQVPDDIAEIVPKYAHLLNKAGCCTRESASEPAPVSQSVAQLPANNAPVSQSVAQPPANNGPVSQSVAQPPANGQPTNGKQITEEDLLSIISTDIAGR